MNKSTALPLQSFMLCAIIIVVAHNGTTANSIAAKNPFTYRGLATLGFTMCAAVIMIH